MSTGTKRARGNESGRLIAAMRKLVMGSSAGPSHVQRPAVAMVQPRPARPPASTKRKGKPAPVRKQKPVGSLGSVTKVTHSTIIAEIKTGTDGKISTSFAVDPTVATWTDGHLTALMKVYEQLRWNKITLEYIPCVGTTEGGFVCIGIDWDSKVPSSIDIPHVSACEPNLTTPPYIKTTMGTGAAKHQFQKWLQPWTGDKIATVLVAGSCKASTTVGYIRVHYTCELQGMRLA